MNPNSSNQDGSPKSMLLAIGLCIAFFFAWNQYMASKYPDFNKPKIKTEELPPQTPVVAPAAPAPMASAPQVADPVATQAPKLPESDLVLDTNDVVFRFSQDLASPTSIMLKGYKETNDTESRAIELLHRPLVVQATAAPKMPAKIQPADYTAARGDHEFTFTRQEGPWKITQTWTLPKTGFVAKLTTTWTNTSADLLTLKPAILFESGGRLDAAPASFLNPGAPSEASRFLTQADGSDDFHNIEEFCKDQTKVMLSKNKKLDFFGFDHHYFAAAFIPAASADYLTTFSSTDNTLCNIVTAVTTDLGNVSAGESVNMSWDAWFGPKEVELLSTFNPHLRTTLGLGWLDMIAHPLLLAIKGLYKFSGNYGIAIILLTLILKIIFFPLAQQAAMSAARMKKFNPEMTKIREKFKSDPQRMNMEIMKFMSTHKINPMKGCLPMLPTIPVFFALFRVLSASIDLRHAPFFGWITDLSAKDPYYVTPIILTGFMFIQQKITPMTGMDPTQEKIMMMMPIIFGVMMISLPSGLVLYMLTNTIFTIVQQQLLNKKLAATA